MAAAPSPLNVEQEKNMLSARQATAPIADTPTAPAEKRALNPVLIVMLVALAVYPFTVGFLPAPVREYLGSLFR